MVLHVETLSLLRKKVLLTDTAKAEANKQTNRKRVSIPATGEMILVQLDLTAIQGILKYGYCH